MNSDETRQPGDLQEEAAALGVPETVEKLRSAIVEFLAAARAVPAEQLGVVDESGKPAGDRMVERCARLVEDARWILHAAWMGYGPADAEPEYPAQLDSALAKLDTSMESLYVHVLEAPSDGNLEFVWPHPVFGDLNWRAWLLALASDAETASQDARAMGAATS